MEETILISYLNDFIFCPVSIYFHKLYGSVDKELYQRKEQVNGIDAHKSIEERTYSTKRSILQAINIYSSQYNIIGKIDLFDINTGVLTERKNKVVEIYDGYIFQLYAQYYALQEMGYEIKKIRLHSIIDNKNYDIKLPEEDEIMRIKFNKLVDDIRNFDMNHYKQTNSKKCENCIYEPVCDRSCL